MKIMSFNCRGLTNPFKKLSLGRLIDLNRLDIVLLQETLGLNVEVYSILETLLPGLKFVANDVCGRSGGLAFGWNLQSCHCVGIWSFAFGIGLELLMHIWGWY